MSNHRKHLLHVRGKEKFVAFIKQRGWKLVVFNPDNGQEQYEHPHQLRVLVIDKPKGEHHQMSGVGATLVSEYNELAAIHNTTPRGALSEITQEARV